MAGWPTLTHAAGLDAVDDWSTQTAAVDGRSMWVAWLTNASTGGSSGVIARTIVLDTSLAITSTHDGGQARACSQTEEEDGGHDAFGV